MQKQIVTPSASTNTRPAVRAQPPSRSQQAARRMNTDHLDVHADAVNVEETPDWWVIPDTILTRDGVQNGARKIANELGRTWMLANGIPITHDHPHYVDEFGIVVDLRRTGGFVDNVRFDDSTGRVIADVYVLKRAVPGYDIHPENVKRNEQVIAALRAGQNFQISIGFWSSDEWAMGEHDGQPYDRIQREIVYDHVALVPLGACGPDCALGSAQPTTSGGDAHHHERSSRATPPASLRGAHHHVHGRSLAASDHAQDPRGTTMPNQDCDETMELQRRLDDAIAKADAATKAATAADARLAALEREWQADRDQRASDAKARVDAKRARLAALTNSNAEDVPLRDEQALDYAIDIAQRARGRADATRTRGAQAHNNQPTDGIVETDRGFTVADWGAAVQAARKGVN